MPFLYSIKLTRAFKKQLSSNDYIVIFDYISSYLKANKAFNIIIENKILSFEAGYNRSNFYVWIPIAGGKFAINNQKNSWLLTYEIFVHKILMIYFLLSIAAYIWLNSIFVSVFFIIICSLNILAVFIIHKNRLKKIVAGIDHLL
jgi:hypothetical protein